MKFLYSLTPGFTEMAFHNLLKPDIKEDYFSQYIFNAAIPGIWPIPSLIFSSHVKQVDNALKKRIRSGNSYDR